MIGSVRGKVEETRVSIWKTVYVHLAMQSLGFVRVRYHAPAGAILDETTRGDAKRMQNGSELNKYQKGFEDLLSLFWSIQTSEAMMEAVVKHVIPDGMRHKQGP